ncbi:MAG: FMN-binding protein [Flavobacteriaceae bacterium]|nr:FMN-binding protein [Flavobacteriaceae bacterium]
MRFSKIAALFLLAFSLALSSFSGLSKNIKKKVDKEIKAAFSTEFYELKTIAIASEINADLPVKIKEHTFFTIVSGDQKLGYAFVDKAPSKTDEFDYLVLFDADLIIKKTKVLVYREDYGGEIGSKRWLKQFNGKSCKERLKYEKDIIAISGATISANSMTVAVNNLLKSIDQLQRQKII